MNPEILGISDEEFSFLTSFRAFLKKEIQPIAFDKSVPIDHAYIQKFASVGYTGLLHEETYGGSASSVYFSILLIEALSEVCGSSFFSIGASVGLFGKPIALFGSLEQKQTFLPKIIRGEWIGCLGITEAQSGSDVLSIETNCKEIRPGEFLLNGSKTYITNAPSADYAIILANLFVGPSQNSESKGLTHFLVNLNSPGVSKGQPMAKMGLHKSPTGELFFEDVLLEKNSVVGGVGKGFRQTMNTFNMERLSIAAYCLGVCNACLRESILFSKTRKSFGKTINKHQSVGNLLAEIYTKTEAIRAFTYQIAKEMDLSNSGVKITNLSQRCASVKLLASEFAREVTNLAVQIHGGAGFMDEYLVSNLYRDIRLAEIGGGTSEIQKQIIAGSL